MRGLGIFSIEAVSRLSLLSCRMLLTSRLTRVLASTLACATVVAGLVTVTNSHRATARPVNYAWSAVAEAFAGRYADAEAMARASSNPAAQKLVEWIYLREQVEGAGYDRLMTFVLANPQWPGAELLRRRAVRMRPAEAPARGEARVAEQKPDSFEDMLALARTCLARNDRQAAQGWAALAWKKLGSDPSVERRVLKEFGSLLSVDDHKRRLWRLISAGETNAAIRAAALLPVEYRQVAKVARELIRGEARVVKLYERLSAALRGQTAMQYAL